MITTSSTEQTDIAKLERVAGRYRIEAQLAAGGVGVVYSAVDESTGQQVALKRLLEEHSNKQRFTRLFQREYHTLAQLQHPRIIEVYDYGVDENGPFYTMELLDGSDLLKLAPLSYEDVCKYLIDVASSLALLHTRRLLHRDISPGNVRCTSEGHCKLLDFGTMATFGVSGEIVGKAPYLCPETLQGMPLDHRSDLYMLGALAYRILTGKHAYPARRIEDLIDKWRTVPKRPSTINSTIPPKLSDLVMSLLNHDPLARPASAAEVIERLRVIAGLPPEEETQMAQSYLLSSAMVGRKNEMKRLRRRLERAVEGHGSAVLIEGQAGRGKTRLLTEVTLHAQLLGAVVLRVGARSRRGPYSVARSLAQSLMEAAPKEALEALRLHAPLLGRVFPEFSTDSMPPVPIPEEATERRARIQAALLAFFVEASSGRTLVIQVDNIHRADESSAAFLSALAHEAKDHRLIVMGTLRIGETMSAPAAIKAFSESGRRIKLSRLTESDTAELIESVFGDTPNADRLAGWMYQVSSGNPLEYMELARHLVDKKIVSYVEGMWVLPAELSKDELPNSLAEAMEARVAALGPGARALAETLSVHRGETSLELCVAVAEDKEEKKTLSNISELIADGVLVSSGDGYRFSQETLREALLMELDDERRRELHLRVGEALLASGTERSEEIIEAGWHVLRGGDQSRGADLLAGAARSLAIQGDAMAAAAPALEAALEVYERERRPPAARVRLKSILVSLGYFFDRGLAERYGEETIRQLFKFSGFSTAARLSPFLGRRLSLLIGILSAVILRLMTPKSKRGPKVQRAINYFFRTTTSLIGVKGICMDIEGVSKIFSYVEPLSGFGRKHAGYAIYCLCQTLLIGIMGRESEAHESCIRTTKLLNDPNACTQLHMETRQGLLSGILNGLGANESFRDGPSVLGVAEQLERIGTRIADVMAHQVRMLYHLMRGEIELTKEHQSNVEMHALQGGTTWQVDLFVGIHEGLASSLQRDVISLKRVIENLTRLSKTIPFLKYHLETMQSIQLYLRGDYQEAIEATEALMASIKPRKHILWQFPYTVQAMALNEIGEHARAKQVCLDALSYANPRDRIYVMKYLRLEQQIAIADAGLGDEEGAAKRIDGLIERHTKYGNPVIMSILHETRAQVAIVAQDSKAFEQHLLEMKRWCHVARNPAMLAYCETIADKGAKAGVSWPPSTDPASADDVATTISSLRANKVVNNVLSRCQNLEESAGHALHMIVEQARGVSGFLYLLDNEKLYLAASLSENEPQEELMERVSAYIDTYKDSESSYNDVDRSTEITLADSRTTETIHKTGHRLIVLSTNEDEQSVIVGAAALQLGSEPLSPLNRDFIEAVALHFQPLV
ncbi:MAG: protein kinase [Proteobacteria bacterium]|nr:protein kinase [Pseudomonadota bacterium]